MAHKIVPMEKKKRIALVAHDNTKPDLMEWTKDNKERLAQHELFATGSTGEQLENELGIEIHKLTSGPLGGRPANRGEDYRGGRRFSGLFLGPSRPPPS
jgi:methylglyoxal synthase